VEWTCVGTLPRYDRFACRIDQEAVMTGSHESEPSTVLVERETYQELVRATRRNVQLAYAAGAIALWSAIVLGVAEGGVTLWVGLFAIIGIGFMARGFLTSRRLTRRFGPPGIPPRDGPFAPIPYVDRQGSMWREGSGGAFPGAGDDGGGDSGS
jgi:hypothetical protein